MDTYLFVEFVTVRTVPGPTRKTRSVLEVSTKATTQTVAQAARNQLESIPESLGHCPCLELMRVAVNNITAVPESYHESPKLAWFSLAGNPVCPAAKPPTRDVPIIPFSDLELDVKLGDGASGDVFQVGWQGEQVRFLPVSIFPGLQ